MADDPTAPIPEKPGAGGPPPAPAVDDEIYSKLVEHAADVQGLLAYGIFRQSERDWIKRFYVRYGKAPTEVEIHDHFYFSYDDGDIDRLRTEAESMMLNFAFAILDDEKAEIEEGARKAARDAQIDGVLVEIRKSGGFWRSVIAGVISSVVFAVLTIVLVAIWFAPGLHDIAKGLSR